MKKTLSLLTGAAFVLAAGLAYGEDSVYSAMGDRNDSMMINNEDLAHIQLDPNRATFNQMPAGSEVEGSAAGGMRAEADGMGTEIDRDKMPADKSPAEPGIEQGVGNAGKGPYTWPEEKDMKKGESPVDKSSEGSAAGGPGDGGATKDSDTYQYQY